MSQNIAFNTGDKPKVNTSTIGHVDHGKTTLTSALTKVSFEKHKSGKHMSYDDIDSTKEERTRGITINASHVWYTSDKKAYIHVDCPGHADYIKNMIVGSSEIDVAILVVSATDGPMPQTKEHVLLVSRIGVPSIIVFINKMDQVVTEDDHLLIDFMEDDIKSLLKLYGYTNVPIIRGSAILALNGDDSEYGTKSVSKLLETLDDMAVKTRPYDMPFLLQVESVCSVVGRGTVATGRVVRGRIKSGKDVEVVGGPKIFKTTITSIEMFRTGFDEASAGDDVGVLLRGVDKEDISRGYYIAAVNTVKTAASFECELLVLTKAEGGRNTSFKCGYCPQFYIRSNDVTGMFYAFEEESNTTGVVFPGDHVRAYVNLGKETVIEVNDRFVVREGKVTIAAGVVTKVLARPALNLKKQ